MAPLLLQAAIALAQQDLQGGIQDLVRQMIASMEEQQKRKLAILDFTKLDGSLDNFGRYLAEGPITSMFLTRKFEVIEGPQLDKILAELKLNLSDLIDPENAMRLGKVYGVDAIAAGSVTELAAAVEVNARLIETETGRVFGVARTQFGKDKDVAALMGGSPAERVKPDRPAPPPSPGTPMAGIVLIPAGPFIFAPEGQEQKMSLSAFYMDIYEVTNAEYAKARPHEYPPDKANHPVVKVSWYDAKRYCEVVGKRLPTEQERDKAARGPDGRNYPWGDSYDQRQVNAENRFKGTTPVGQFPAGKRPYGLFEMAGNVWEWTAPDMGDNKVVRGGGWNYSPFDARAANRYGILPEDRYGVNVGVRCAKAP